MRGSFVHEYLKDGVGTDEQIHVMKKKQWFINISAHYTLNSILSTKYSDVI